MMDYAISFHYGALHIPSTNNRAVRVARPLSSFKHSSLSLSSSASTHRALSRHALSPVVCAHHRPSSTPSRNDKDNGKVVKILGGASLVFACVLGIVNYQFNFNPAAIAGSHPQRTTVDKLILTRPKDVLESFLEVPQQLTIPKTSWRNRFKSTPQLILPARPTNDHYKALQRDIAYLIKHGKSDEAEKQLRELVKSNNGGEVAYEVELELVVLLILQGRYREALGCSCFKDVPLNDHDSTVVPGDGRLYLYMAINYTMLEDNQKAKICWEKYISSFGTNPPNADGLSPQGLPYR